MLTVGSLRVVTTGTGLDIAGSSNVSVDIDSASVNATAGDGIRLSSNTGTFNFGSVSIATGSGDGVVANVSGTLNIVGTANTVSTNGGTVLNVLNTTIGSSGLTFQNISAADGMNGIILDNTGSDGDFTVTGDGSGDRNGSCGTIQGTSGVGVLLTNTQNVSLSQMTIDHTGGHGLHATGGISGLALNHSIVSDAGIEVGLTSLSTITRESFAGKGGNVCCLRDITQADFYDCVGQELHVRGRADGSRLDTARLVLTEAVAYKDSHVNKRPANVRQQPFMLVFHASHKVNLGQDTYHMDHPDLGSFELFLVPDGLVSGERESRYVAVFN